MSSVKDSYTLMIILLQVVEISRSWSLFALGVFEVVSALIGKLNYLVRSLLVWVELPVRRVLGVSSELP